MIRAMDRDLKKISEYFVSKIDFRSHNPGR